jgi:hypothetical protein
MAFESKYAAREIAWGNELLIFGTLATENTQPTDLAVVTGLVSVSAMENQAEITNYPADDVPNHGSKKGADLLQGELALMQIDDEVKTALLGHVATANGLGTIATGQYPKKIVQYISPAQRQTATGVEKGYVITVYPQLEVTGEPTKETETESTDGVDPFQWTLPVQASSTDLYKQVEADTSVVGKFPEAIYHVWGSDATLFETKMENELFVMLPNTGLTPDEEPTQG